MPPGAAVCAACGAAAPWRLPPRRLALIAAGAVGSLGLARGLLGRTPVPDPAEAPADCEGGEDVSVAWRTLDPLAPAIDTTDVYQMDPRVTPFVERARLRHSGPGAYAYNNVHYPRHIHAKVAAAVRSAGGNAYFHGPPQSRPDARSETITTAVVAHAGPVPKALRDAHFPAGRAAMVLQVDPGGAAAAGGLQPNDLIVRARGHVMAGNEPHGALLTIGSAVPEDGELPLEVIRGDRLVSLRLERRGTEKFRYWAATVPVLQLR